jgi:hypothetical protein
MLRFTWLTRGERTQPIGLLRQVAREQGRNAEALLLQQPARTQDGASWAGRIDQPVRKRHDTAHAYDAAVQCRPCG